MVAMQFVFWFEIHSYLEQIATIANFVILQLVSVLFSLSEFIDEQRSQFSPPCL